MSRSAAASALTVTLTLALGCTAEISGPDGAGASAASAASGGGGNAGSAGTRSVGGSSGQAGAGGAAGTGAAAGTTAVCTPEGARDTAANVLRRLSVAEYQLTLQDLFALASPPSVDTVPADVYQEGFSTIAEAQAMSPAHLRAYLGMAGTLANALLADSARSATVIGCELTAADCLPGFVSRFGRLAFRRPLAPTEVDGLTQAATTNATDATDRFRYVLEALLSSPNFLYRVEVGDTPDGLSTLDGYELASRLSFALWGRAPSGELLDRAAAGELDTPEGLQGIAESMLTDARAHGFFAAFFRQWLGYETLRAPTQPPADWSSALLPAMQAETDQVMSDHAWGNGSLLDALTASTTRVSPELSLFYGLPAPAADGRVSIPAGHPREGTGLLTHASLLSAKSDGDPIAIRGNWLRRTFLCETVQPIDLADIGEELVGLTRIEIVQRRNTQAQCAGCHALIDPIGVGFARFDATGRFDAALDPSVYGIASALPDAPVPEFSSVAELAEKLKALPAVPACVTNKTFRYVNGRASAPADACAIEATSRAFADGSYDFAALLRGLVEAPQFRLRRAPAL